ncbi:hypothetical protein [Cylindrospermum sp. FACHB-282]|uniref:hypothetical protein n=1 Tax=Cylindrospermum sp. FACHB-282 TaxID=2692794 RepID=UPI00168299EB|nr:hypothetical protein [Cylindrospermum sp. FACHB-282]MBD2387515.1 hypothetical protein [Cylindrospermum sp. FACHB-282]
MARRRKYSWLQRRIRNCQPALAKIYYVILIIGRFVNYIYNYAIQLIKYLAGKKLLIFVLLLSLAVVFISLAAILPGTHIFEGNLIVEEMSFTYNGQRPKLFLSSIRHLSNLETSGMESVNFTGKFQSASLPQINQLKTLNIQLIDSKSKLIIAPINPRLTSEIDLTEMRLQPNTRITGLNYDFYNKRLAFGLENQSIANTINKPNILQLYLGDQPLKVSLERYSLPDINLVNNLDTPLEFILIPENREVQLELSKNHSIYLATSQISKTNLQQWFRAKIATKDVQFQRLDRSGDIRDDLATSTIREGKVRMVEQEREIKDNQFLMGENPDIPLNIELIRNLQIVPEKGLEVRFAGRTKNIKIGLDKDFPVSSIQGSWLDGILPRDAIIALFSFGAATITYLLSFVIDNASKSNSKP